MVVVDSSPTTKKKQSKPAGGLASKLFNKFDSDRKYDPFMAADLVIQDSKKGMENLLLMCNTVEINSLHSALGFSVPCPRKAKEQEVRSASTEARPVYLTPQITTFALTRAWIIEHT